MTESSLHWNQQQLCHGPQRAGISSFYGGKSFTAGFTRTVFLLPETKICQPQTTSQGSYQPCLQYEPAHQMHSPIPTKSMGILHVEGGHWFPSHMVLLAWSSIRDSRWLQWYIHNPWLIMLPQASSQTGSGIYLSRIKQHFSSSLMGGGMHGSLQSHKQVTRHSGEVHATHSAWEWAQPPADKRKTWHEKKWVHMIAFDFCIHPSGHWQLPGDDWQISGFYAYFSSISI